MNKVDRIPYVSFKHALMQVADREGLILKEIDPKYTSQTCPGVDREVRSTGAATSTSNASNADMRLTETTSQASKSSVPKRYFLSLKEASARSTP